VRPTGHTNPSKKKRAFQKLSSNWMNLKMPALRFSVDGKHFDKGAFQEQCHHDNRVILLPEFCSNTK